MNIEGEKANVQEAAHHKREARKQLFGITKPFSTSTPQQQLQEQLTRELWANWTHPQNTCLIWKPGLIATEKGSPYTQAGLLCQHILHLCPEGIRAQVATSARFLWAENSGGCFSVKIPLSPTEPALLQRPHQGESLMESGGARLASSKGHANTS